jgi:hypothetical protein
VPTASLTGARYVLTLIDEHHYSAGYIFLLKSLKCSTPLRALNLRSKTSSICKLVSYVLTVGGEYVSKIFSEFLVNHGLSRQLTTAQTPEQYSIAERKNRTLIEAVRTIAAETHVPSFLWDKLVSAAAFVQSRTATRALSRKTPFQKLYLKKPNVSELRIIGSSAQIWIPKEQQNKLQSKSKLNTIFVGYDSESKAYRCYCPTDKKICVSRNVEFNKNAGHVFDNLESKTELLTPSFFDNLFDNVEQPPPAASALTPEAPLTGAQNVDDPLDVACPSESTALTQEPNTMQDKVASAPASISAVNTRPVCDRRPPAWHSHYIPFNNLSCQVCDAEFAFDVTDKLDEEMTLAEALRHPGWRKAMESEFSSLMENGTWKLVELPPGHRALSARWVLRLKPDLNPTHTRLKARLVPKGYEQTFGIDYTKTFAPVIKWSTLRLVIALAAALGSIVTHMDVVTAFLNGKLTETIYMYQPPGFEVPGLEHLVCLLLRSIYGLNQSPRTWYFE